MLGGVVTAAWRGSHADLIEDVEALAGIEDEWKHLAEIRGNAFVTPEWFTTWLSHHGDRADPAVVVARRDDGSLLGVMPFVRSHGERPRRIRFAGASLGDHFHPAAAAIDERAVAQATARALPPNRGYNALVLDNVDTGTAWSQELTEQSERRLVTRTVKGSVLPYTDLPRSWEAFLETRSSNFRRDLRRRLRRLESSHTVGIRRTATDAELSTDLETVFRLHDLRWAERGGSSTSGPRTRAFLSAFAARALERGWLRLWTLTLDREPAAAYLQWRLGSRVAGYLTGFDPKFEREGVGFALTAHTIQAAIEEGADQFDMLLGDARWKARFSTGQREVSTLVVVPARHPVRLVVTAEVAMRRVVDGIPPAGQAVARSLASPIRRFLPTARRR